MEAHIDSLPAGTHAKCGCNYLIIKVSRDKYVFESGREISREEVLSEHLPLTVLTEEEIRNL